MLRDVQLCAPAPQPRCAHSCWAAARRKAAQSLPGLLATPCDAVQPCMPLLCDALQMRSRTPPPSSRTAPEEAAANSAFAVALERHPLLLEDSRAAAVQPHLPAHGVGSQLPQRRCAIAAACAACAPIAAWRLPPPTADSAVASCAQFLSL